MVLDKEKTMNKKWLLIAWVTIVGGTSAAFVADGRPEALGWFIPMCLVFMFVSGIVVSILRSK